MSREMKDSGIEWAGRIPESWNKSSLRHITVARDSGSWGTDPVENENNRICIRIADFDYSHMTIREDRDFTIRNYSSKEIARLTLKKNDLLVEKSGGGEKTPVGRVILWDKPFDALFANFIERLRLNEKKVVPDYIQYCLYTFYAQGFSRFYFNQTTGLQNLDVTKWMRETGIPIPSLSEQHLIADFLDSKCSQIDEISKKIREEIDTLEEYKKSIITEAVTKGLDPNAEMKDSGIEWIGEIPEKWSLNRVANIFSERNEPGEDGLPFLSVSINSGISDKELSEEETSRQFIRADAKKNKKVYPGDIVYNMMRAWQGAIGAVRTEGMVSAAYVTAKPTQTIDTRYFEYLLRTPTAIQEMNKYSYGIMDFRKRLYWSYFKNISLCIPPLTEQVAIADYADEITRKTDSFINTKQQQLSTLEDYKKSLIYEYVTGKKEVAYA